MHLVHVTASTFFGGPERQMLGLAKHLPPNVRTTVLSFREGGRCEAFLQVVRAAGFDARAIAQDTPRLRSAIRELTNTLASVRATHVLLHGYKANLLGRVAAHNLRLPAVSISRGWTGEDRKVRLYERLDRWLLNRSDHIVAVSAGQAAKVRACGVPEQKLTVIRNAARLDAFAVKQAEYESKLRSLLPSNIKTIVVAAGRLSPEKGFDVLVDAAAKTAEDIGFIHFGDGGEKVAIQSQIESLNLSKRFILAGPTTELDALLPWADMLVLPSHTEGLPNVVLEAAATGVPVVATAVGGTPEVVADGVTGYLVADNDIEAMSRRIVELANNKAMRKQFGDAGRARMQREFTFDAQARQYVALMHKLAPALARAA